MLKTIQKSKIISLMILGFMLVVNKVAFAVSECTLNGQEVDCAELGNAVGGFLGWGIGALLVFFALGIWATVFWVMMIVHAIKHEVSGKVAWIILMLFTGFIGALIYYFTVKRKFQK